MNNEQLGKLFHGKRVEEVLMDIPFMTEAQMSELSEFIWAELWDDTADGGGGTDEIWALMGERHAYYADVLEREFDSIVARGEGIRLHDGDKFIIDAEAHQAILAVFGPMAFQTYTRYEPARPETVEALETSHSVQVDIPCAGMVVDFMGGRRIHFTNSEWASMTLQK